MPEIPWKTRDRSYPARVEMWGKHKMELCQTTRIHQRLKLGFKGWRATQARRKKNNAVLAHPKEQNYTGLQMKKKTARRLDKSNFSQEEKRGPGHVQQPHRMLVEKKLKPRDKALRRVTKRKRGRRA